MHSTMTDRRVVISQDQNAIQPTAVDACAADDSASQVPDCNRTSEFCIAVTTGRPYGTLSSALEC